ncbi:MAG TPA: Flp family type IVb pilin [Solibacterales bacterium]|nr:Flp family type IVb pilin [Bryobacterales bacterium]
MKAQLTVLQNAFRRFYLDNRGQDLIEYALLTAFVAVAVSAFLPPNVAPAISGIFSRISMYLSKTPG